MNRNDIKEGYILTNLCKDEYIVINYKNKQHIINTIYICTDPLDNIIDSELNTINGHLEIMAIKNKCGETVWEMPIELTMQEIADKFGISVEQLRIKE